MKVRLEIRATHRSFSFEHEGPSLHIGRDPSCQLCLSEKYETVSWKHARIDLHSAGATVTDLGSTNGTLINGKKLDGSTRLKLGDVIRLGQTGPTLEVAELNLGKRRSLGPARAPRKHRGCVVVAALGFVALLCVALMAGGGYYIYRNWRPATVPDDSKKPGADELAALPQKANAFLKKYCYECHGGKKKRGGLDVLDDAQLLHDGYIVPGNPEESSLWKEVAADKMPPRKEARRFPTDEEKEDLRRWIQHVAFKDVPDSRKPHQKVIAAIHDHLSKVPAEERRFHRYFVLTHWAGNPRLKDGQARLWAGLSRLANSLSWKPEIVPPDKVDSAGLVHHLDLRSLGWEGPELWTRIVEDYPYALSHAGDDDSGTAKKAEEIYRDTQTPIPFVRADWFVARASRPPLYHLILDLPRTLKPLEDKLEVASRADLDKALKTNPARPLLRRAGFSPSDISAQNRLIERHPAKYGAYWKSYDFKNDDGDGPGDLMTHPLGPLFPGHPFAKHAFIHDGGEIIFNLPNGLQAYMLVDAKDNRIDVGPTAIVSDRNQPFGTPDVINGLSCIHCHKRGMKVKDDQVRSVAPSSIKAQVDKLYAGRDELHKLFQQDEQRFLKAAAQTNKGFLPNNASPDDEPVGESVTLYLQTLKVEDVARELGVDDAKAVQQKIKDTPRLRELGLGPLAVDLPLKRERLESPRGPFSPWQELARELSIGEPVRGP